MSEEKFQLVIEAIKDQREIFGDDLFDEIKLSPKIIDNPIEDGNNIMPKTFNNLDQYRTLDELFNGIKNCKNCALGNTRIKFVFGSGNPNADVMLIGEAPGAEEDKQGKPFVGRAGNLLTDILKAINFEREEVFIANILKCRPPNNRNPLSTEMDECTPYLYKQIELVKPKVILLLGLVAASSLLKSKLSLTKLRNSVHEINGIKTMVTYHPAALLRNPNWKRGCWEDVQKFRKLYDSLSK